MEPGEPIGEVSIVGNLILMELGEGTLGRENLFDLDRQTLRRVPQRAKTAVRPRRAIDIISFRRGTRRRFSIGGRRRVVRKETDFNFEREKAAKL